MDGEALPKTIHMWDDFISASSSLPVPEPGSERVYRLVVYLSNDDQIGTCYRFIQSPKDLDDLRHWCKAVHVLDVTDGREAVAFDLEEIDCDGYRENPWLKYQWYRSNMRRWIEMVPRASERNPGQLAYFQDAEKRKRNIRTPIKAGRWLGKVFSDILDQQQIQILGVEYETQFMTHGVTITQDSDEIETVYRAKYLGSCMHFGTKSYAGSCHPARVYGGPDLGIAYLGDKHNPEARCLVWPDKQIYFPKWYGDEHRLERSLKAIGYSAGDADDFDGARIRRIKYRGAYVVPYSDTHDYAYDDGEYLVLGRGRIYLENTNGLSGDMTQRDCYHCDEATDEDNLNSIHNGNQVCDHCLSDHYFMCDIEEEWYDLDDMAPTPDEYSVSEYGVRHSHRWFYCPKTEKHYPHSNYEEVSLFEGGSCVEEHAEEHGFYCEHSEEWSLETAKQLKLSNNTSVHMDSFNSNEALREWLAEQELHVVYDDPNQLEIALEAA